MPIFARSRARGSSLSSFLSALGDLITFLVPFGRTPIHPVHFYAGILGGFVWWLSGMTWQGLIAAYAVAAIGSLGLAQHRARARAHRTVGGAR